MAEDKGKREEVERLKKEIAQLKYEEDLLRKQDERLKWEEDLLEKEEAQRNKRPKAINEPQEEAIDELEKNKDADQAGKSKIGGTQEKQAEIEPGLMYVLEEEQPDKSVRLFLQEKEKSPNGLYITRANPDYTRRKHNLNDTRIVWLTSVKTASGFESISGLQELSILISNFIDEHNKSVILLDGLEYLVSNNEFPIVLRLIQQVRDRVSTSESVMFVPVNPNALEQKQLTLLKRECRALN